MEYSNLTLTSTLRVTGMKNIILRKVLKILRRKQVEKHLKFLMMETLVVRLTATRKKAQ